MGKKLAAKVSDEEQGGRTLKPQRSTDRDRVPLAPPVLARRRTVSPRWDRVETGLPEANFTSGNHRGERLIEVPIR